MASGDIALAARLQTVLHDLGRGAPAETVIEYQQDMLGPIVPEPLGQVGVVCNQPVVVSAVAGKGQQDGTVLRGRVHDLSEQHLEARASSLLLYQLDGRCVGQRILPEGSQRRSIPVGAAQLGNAWVEVAVDANKAGE